MANHNAPKPANRAASTRAPRARRCHSRCRFRQPVLLSSLAIALLTCGCSAGPEPTYPVQGVVTVDDVPLEGGSILFEPVEPVPGGSYYSARGTIDATGRYELSTFGEHDGAVAGKHYVMVFEQEKQLSDDPNLVRYTLIPEAYHTPQTTPLVVEVRPEPNEINVPVVGKSE
jgi:hypothetical protein